MHLLVFSYPEHFYISQLAAQAALKNLVGVTRLTFVWDDVANINKADDYISRLKNRFNCEVIRFSQFPETADEPNGWLRQQYVKIQLHKVLPENYWILLDGDVIVNKKIKVEKLLLTHRILFVNRECDPRYFDFIEHSLNLKKQNDFSFICPLFLFERDVLEALEDHCVKLHGKGLIKTFKEWNNKTDIVPPFSEFEIYGTFATQVLNKKYRIVSSDFVEISNTKKFLKQLGLKKYNIILKGRDQDLIDIDSEFVNFKF